MVVGFAQGIKMSMVYVEKYITDSECLAVRKDAGINSLKDLKGKKIGLPFNTSVHFAMLAGAEDRGPAAASDVTLINVKADSILATWQRKDIDGAYIWHPVLGDLLADNGKLLLKTGDLAATRHAGLRRHRRARRVQAEASGSGARLSQGIRSPVHDVREAAAGSGEGALARTCR